MRDAKTVVPIPPAARTGDTRPGNPRAGVPGAGVAEAPLADPRPATLTVNPTDPPARPIEVAGLDEALRLQQIRRAQAFREGAAARRWVLGGWAFCLICLAGVVLSPPLWLFWFAGGMMGATAILLGRATRREAQAASRAADQAIAQLQPASRPDRAPPGA